MTNYNRSSWFDIDIRHLKCLLLILSISIFHQITQFWHLIFSIMREHRDREWKRIKKQQKLTWVIAHLWHNFKQSSSSLRFSNTRWKYLAMTTKKNYSYLSCFINKFRIFFVLYKTNFLSFLSLFSVVEWTFLSLRIMAKEEFYDQLTTKFHFLSMVGSPTDFVFVFETRMVAVVWLCFLLFVEFDEWVDSVGEVFVEGDFASRLRFRVKVPAASLFFSPLSLSLASLIVTLLLLLLLLSLGCLEMKISSEKILWLFSMRLSFVCKFCRSHVVLWSWKTLSISFWTPCRLPICIENCWKSCIKFFTIGSLFLSLRLTLTAFNSPSLFINSFSRPSIRLFNIEISFLSSSVNASLAELPPFDVSKSWILTFSLWFSSLYECNCRFHSSTFAVDSYENNKKDTMASWICYKSQCEESNLTWSALVNLRLLLLSVLNSISHFFAFAELKSMMTKERKHIESSFYDFQVTIQLTFGLMLVSISRSHTWVADPSCWHLQSMKYL